uniref:NADH dehydrogenase subunit 3 n=1 Tax=Phyllodoce medipapillata TaxID=868040 RepID=UPI0030FE452F
MLLSLFSWFLALVVSFGILLAGIVLSMNSYKDREKSSPFECGFDPKGSARVPFSMRFFVLAVIFLVFDIEIALLMPLPLMMSGNLFVEILFGVLIFLLILILGLVHEWREGSLDWSE